MKRKLTTVLEADVVGYSALMAVNEEETLRTFRAYRELIDELITKHEGRLFNTSGDAILVEFSSAVEAVRFAIGMQEEIAVRNAELPKDRQIWFRVGLNVGDVIIEGNDLYGDGVNVAARLEGISQKGGICVSGSTFEQVKNKLSIRFQDIGPQQVKNIPYEIQAFQIVHNPVSVSPGDGPNIEPSSATKPTNICKAPLLYAIS